MHHSVSFRGTAKEYFGIWIVNTMLKVITLTAYSAWAKVRKRRYFAENIYLDGEPFEYLASPGALFRGWLVAALVFVLYTVAERFSVVLSGVLGLMITLFIPWVVVKSQIFNARNTAYRNIRFSFAPNYSEAYGVLLGYWFLAMITLGILAPYAIYRQNRFFVENRSYGATPFRFNATAGDFYVIFLKMTLWLLCGIIVVTIAGVLMFMAEQKNLIIVLGLSAYLMVFAYYKTAVMNLVWNHTELGELSFHSSMAPLTVFWLYLSGAVGVVLSLGLLFPWASVRLTNYRCETLAVRSREGIGQFVADTTPVTVGALGEEIGDMFGWDMEIGF